MIAIVAVFGCVSIYQDSRLKKIVADANEQQQQNINNVSQETMEQVISGSLVKSTGQQAYMANDLFEDIKVGVKTLQSTAEKIFEGRDSLSAQKFYPPDKTKNGKVSVQLVSEDGGDHSDSKDLGLIANLSSTMEALFTNNSKLNSCFVALPEGTCLIADDKSGSKFDENGNVIKLAVTQRKWYKGAIEKGDVFFTGVEYDTFTKKTELICAAPVYNNGKIVAVVGADLFLDSISDYVNKSSQEGAFVCVINDSGHVIFSPETSGTFKVESADTAKDLRESDNKDLADFIKSAYKERTDLKTITIDGSEMYICGAPVENVGWTIVSVVDKKLTHQPTEKMLSEYDRVNDEAQDVFSDGIKMSERTTLILIFVVLSVGLATAMYIANKIVKPVEHMTRRIQDLSGDDIRFKMEDIYRTNDEIELLAEAFDELSEKTVNYINEITEITKEKERIGTELELARKIQANMLPNLFPAFPDRPEFDIYATMKPAKEVGGDFYDFFLIDDDHLALVMADVSGKGVPAALFMMMSKILVNNYAMLGRSPAQVLEMTNKTICKNNEEEMFVTIWLGVLEISTGKLKAANAGHEYPVIKSSDGKFELVKDTHGFVVGGFEGQKFKDYELTIEKGGTLFVYTDGVVEATNSEEKLFGSQRLVDALNISPESAPQELLETVKKQVDEFVGKSAQADDLTMLSVKLL